MTMPNSNGLFDTLGHWDFLLGYLQLPKRHSSEHSVLTLNREPGPRLPSELPGHTQITIHAWISMGSSTKEEAGDTKDTGS